MWKIVIKTKNCFAQEIFIKLVSELEGQNKNKYEMLLCIFKVKNKTNRTYTT